jgi:F-type H+-transporting ATPase subunit gamma
MPNLKDLKVRIRSVKSTQKITKAMKMVAASRLRRAQMRAKEAHPYAERMERMLASLATAIKGSDAAPKLLVGTGSDQVHLLVVMTSDRGLCGGFNGSIVRATKRKITELTRQHKKVKLLCVGSKGYDQLKHSYERNIADKFEGLSKKSVTFEDAEDVSIRIQEMFEAGEFDVCTVIYNTFKSAIAQVVTYQQLIPLQLDESQASVPQGAVYEFEPSEEAILKDLLPENLAVQIFHGLLESSASEQGARMTAMDNATRNAGEMIKKLTLQYNRTRQAAITKELIEIISGAEAL